MTRKQMIAACVDEQIERGIAKAENRAAQINYRLKGGAGIKAMSLSECEKWYNEVFKA